MDYKEMWIEQYEQRLGELEQAGITGKRAEDIAADDAFILTQDFLADLADNARQRAKDEGQ